MTIQGEVCYYNYMPSPRATEQQRYRAHPPEVVDAAERGWFTEEQWRELVSRGQRGPMPVSITSAIRNGFVPVFYLRSENRREIIEVYAQREVRRRGPRGPLRMTLNGMMEVSHHAASELYIRRFEAGQTAYTGWELLRDLIEREGERGLHPFVPPAEYARVAEQNRSGQTAGYLYALTEYITDDMRHLLGNNNLGSNAYTLGHAHEPERRLLDRFETRAARRNLTMQRAFRRGLIADNGEWHLMQEAFRGRGEQQGDAEAFGTLRAGSRKWIIRAGRTNDEGQPELLCDFAISGRSNERIWVSVAELLDYITRDEPPYGYPVMRQSCMLVTAEQALNEIREQRPEWLVAGSWLTPNEPRGGTFNYGVAFRHAAQLFGSPEVSVAPRSPEGLEYEGPARPSMEIVRKAWSKRWFTRRELATLQARPPDIDNALFRLVRTDDRGYFDILQAGPIRGNGDVRLELYQYETGMRRAARRGLNLSALLRSFGDDGLRRPADIPDLEAPPNYYDRDDLADAMNNTMAAIDNELREDMFIAERAARGEDISETQAMRSYLADVQNQTNGLLDEATLMDMEAQRCHREDTQGRRGGLGNNDQRIKLVVGLGKRRWWFSEAKRVYDKESRVVDLELFGICDDGDFADYVYVRLSHLPKTIKKERRSKYIGKSLATVIQKEKLLI